MGPVTYHLPQQGTYTLPVPYLHRITYASERYASYWIVSLHIRSMWEAFCDAQAGFWLNSKFLSKFSRKPLSGISDQKAPPFGKLQIWDDQSLLRNTLPFWKSSDLRWPRFTLKYLPISEKFRFEMTKVYSEIPPPHFGKLQIWDDQSLLQNTPPPPISENFRFEMTKVYSKIPPPPHFGKLQIWDDQSLLRNIPPPFQKIREIVCGD